ncbi:DNA-binding protein c1d [Chamberlinius hualienensis]
MDVPIELQEKMIELQNAIDKISKAMEDVLEKPPQETRDKLEPLEKAKFDLVCAYVINSLFWVYLNTKGENPQNHGIKQELERIQFHMNKVRDIIDKPKAPKIDVGSAKRMVRHSLWTPKEKDENVKNEDDCEVVEEINRDQIDKRTAANTSSKGSRKKQRK